MRTLTARILTLAQQGHGLREAIEAAQAQEAAWTQEARAAAWSAAGPCRSLTRYSREKTTTPRKEGAWK